MPDSGDEFLLGQDFASAGDANSEIAAPIEPPPYDAGFELRFSPVPRASL